MADKPETYEYITIHSLAQANLLTERALGRKARETSGRYQAAKFVGRAERLQLGFLLDLLEIAGSDSMLE